MIDEAIECFEEETVETFACTRKSTFTAITAIKSPNPVALLSFIYSYRRSSNDFIIEYKLH